MDNLRTDPTRRSTLPTLGSDSCDHAAATGSSKSKADLDGAVAALPDTSAAAAMFFRDTGLRATAQVMRLTSSVGGSTGTAAPKAATRESLPITLPVAPNAVRGVTIAYLAENLPVVNRSAGDHRIVAGEYKLEPMLAKQPDGSHAVVYYQAFNTESKRVEFVVGPDSVEAFKSQPDWFRAAGALAYAQGVPRTAWEMESARMMASVMRDGFKAGFTHFASAWNEALRDPKWWGRTASTLVTAPAVLETGTPILGRLSARAARVTETARAELGAAEPLILPAELEPMTALERQSIGDFLAKTGTVKPSDIPKMLDGMGSGARIETLADDLRVVRYSGGDSGPVGRWLTEAPVRDPARDLALDTTRNTTTYLDSWIVPRGTTVVRSPVAPLNGMPGGATQVFVPDAAVLRGTAPAPGIMAPGTINAIADRTSNQVDDR